GVIVTILGITASVTSGIGYSGIGLTVVGVISIVKGSEELIDGNLTDAVTSIVNGINSVKQNAPKQHKKQKQQLELRIFPVPFFFCNLAFFRLNSQALKCI